METLTRLIAEALFAEDDARHDGLLQRIEPRIKVLCTVALAIAALLARSLLGLLAGYGALLALGRASGIGIGKQLKRVWFFVPLFAGITVLPMLFNVFRPPANPADVLIVLAVLPEPVRAGPLGTIREITITRSGARAVAGFILRVADTVSLAVLLTLSTRWRALLRALRVFGLPRLIVLLLEMTQRYIVLLARLVLEMHLGMEARSPRPLRPRQGRRWVAAHMMALLGKSLTLGEEVFLAMTARGYTGEPRSLPGPRPGRRDAVALAVALLILAGAGWDHVHG